RLAALCPPEAEPWALLAQALLPVAPRHADALAAARHAQVPGDPDPLLLRHRIALADGRAALALHHARLLRALAPEDAQAQLAVALSLRAFDPPRLGEARDALEQALREAPLTDRARGEVEEELVRTLLDLGDAASIARARELVPDLLRRPAEREARRRRELMVRRIPEPE
ncbi:MAG: hypothetical protein KC501_29570, partial [Myxococcales bacterium]|nr:hypothetical protein [Myxococcales bacterium]